eukprot:g6367.t1
MERVMALSRLRTQSGFSATTSVEDQAWIAKHRWQTHLIIALLRKEPSQRPTAQQVLAVLQNEDPDRESLTLLSVSDFLLYDFLQQKALPRVSSQVEQAGSTYEHLTREGLLQVIEQQERQIARLSELCATCICGSSNNNSATKPAGSGSQDTHNEFPTSTSATASSSSSSSSTTSHATHSPEIPGSSSSCATSCRENAQVVRPASNNTESKIAPVSAAMKRRRRRQKKQAEQTSNKTK